MSDVPTLVAATAAPVPPPAPSPPVPPAPPAGRSRAWVGVLAAFVAIALLAGATAVLFVRVQEAQDRADDAVRIAGTQQVLEARIDDVDTSLASLESSGAATANDVAAARDQVVALRKCVNSALDAVAQATQSGKPMSVTKC